MASIHTVEQRRPKHTRPRQERARRSFDPANEDQTITREAWLRTRAVAPVVHIVVPHVADREASSS
jgi:hypothetical protein